jgi:hypothetical protein
MFVSERFVYIELHKTGCTHIRNIMSELLDGELIGKHNQATPELFRPERIFFGSVRNQWAWYTSLWAYGCDNRGALYNHVTRASAPIRELGWGRNPYIAFLRLLATRSRNPKAWKDKYADINDASAFREWLYMMHNKECLTDIGEGYSACPIRRVAGLMTFRYLTLYCAKSNEQGMLDEASTNEQILEYEQRKCFINHFVKNETLEADLFSGLANYGVNNPKLVQAELLSRPKTNTSSKKHSPEYYYDIKTSNLVAEREKLIVEKFGYVAPNLEAAAKPGNAPVMSSSIFEPSHIYGA